MSSSTGDQEIVGAGLRVTDLRSQNPWWDGSPQPRLPAFRRRLFGQLRRRLDRPLAPILMVRGPRQVGKTTLQEQLIEQLLADGTPPRTILRAQFDDAPSLRRSEHALLDVARWYERDVLGTTFNEASRSGSRALLFLDEVQNLRNWDVQLKQLVDFQDVTCLVTGSSALRIGLGRDSLAGRIQSFDLGALRLGEIAEVRGLSALRGFQDENGWQDWLRPDFWRDLAEYGRAHATERDAAFAAFSERGAYPRSQLNSDLPWPEVADQLRETVVRRVIQHDLRLGDRGRKRDPQLLEEVFRLACRYAGQAPRPSLLAREARERLQTDVSDQRVRHYLDFLDSSLLVRAVDPLELRLGRQRGNARLCLCDHGVRAAWLQEQVPLVPSELAEVPHLATVAGHLVESVVGYYLTTLTSLDVSHLPERAGQPEVDFVVTVGTRRLPIEVKYQRRISPERDGQGLTAFLDKPANEATVGLLLCQDATGVRPADPRVVPLALADFLLVR